MGAERFAIGIVATFVASCSMPASVADPIYLHCVGQQDVKWGDDQGVTPFDKFYRITKSPQTFAEYAPETRTFEQCGSNGEGSCSTLLTDGKISFLRTWLAPKGSTYTLTNWEVSIDRNTGGFAQWTENVDGATFAGKVATSKEIYRATANCTKVANPATAPRKF